MNKQLLLPIGIALAFVVIVIIVIINAITPRATIIFSLAPSEATVSINGKKQGIKNQQSVTVSPGELTIITSRSEFADDTQKITIKNGETYNIIVILSAQTDAARALLQTPESQQVMEQRTGRELQKATEQANEKYPILGVLPINDKYYTILPCSSEKYPDDTSKVAVCIKLYNPEARQSALDEITSRGFKLEDYEIIIIDSSYQPENDDNYEAS
ncbi:MAG: PEGA domain-containing protein [Candidatus Microsaccharimonas sp.]